MLKKIILKTLKRFGYSLVKDSNLTKTKSSSELSYYETKTGNYFLPTHAHSDLIKQAIVANEIFDQPIVDLASHYIKKGTVVLDVGSNFGQMAILYSNLVGENGHVHAFDADDFIYNILKKNVEANNKKNITTHFGAVYNVVDEILHFPVQDFERFETYGSYGVDYNKEGVGREVKTITIDSLGIEDEISLMKVDVQGGDLFALQGAKETIKKHRMPIIFEYEYLFEEDMNLNFQEYVDFVNEINYKFERVINGQNYLILPR